MATRRFTYQFTCIQCGNETVRGCTPGGVKPTLCSNACKVARHRAMNPDRYRRYREAEKAKAASARGERKCRDCGISVLPRRSVCDACKKSRPAKPRMCRTCGVTRIYKGAQRCVPCQENAAAKSREKRRRKEVEEGIRAAWRKRRKAMLRGAAVETVNPLKVLQRDMWVCQLCGRKTPKQLRGTYEPDAPEVDHIIPLAAGGEHSYRNVQCACRRCNLAKSARPLGQMRLFG